MAPCETVNFCTCRSARDRWPRTARDRLVCGALGREAPAKNNSHSCHKRVGLDRPRGFRRRRRKHNYTQNVLSETTSQKQGRCSLAP
ncbi:hypothetical protein LSTR_LSTR000885 [Laodelphax striatellus]|uniref:Uncharacterized protein n=1 Tax=Laodelphax striatellus TaxID=195883 RepID=A0A482X0M7_LAOST|nr:hypothetical protein LSTR_LSTR000885 [Laodelphax striatellus]